ncbi:YqhA family protein [Vulcanococcus limneticus]|uniref:YqhA family protein n=1 Tax=Vulcanococcus limneticus TaxID=2170428 RepID=UPI0028F400CB|nr:YqhA family protein [Vulcanococcus limneticus]
MASHSSSRQGEPHSEGPQHGDRVPARRSRLEMAFERWLWRIRLIAILPVVMSLLSSATAFICGTRIILSALKLLMAGGKESAIMAKLLGELVGGIDLYLIGIALLIFGYGVYELLISDIEAARIPGQDGGSGLLDIRTLDALKEKLVKVIVVALIVAAFKSMLDFPIAGPTSLLMFSGSVLLLALSAWLVAGGPHARRSGE